MKKKDTKSDKQLNKETEYKDNLALLNTAFTKLEPYKTKWLEYERYYDAKHTKEQFDKLEKLGRSKLFIPTTRNIVNIIRSIFSTSFFSQGNPIELSVTNAESNENMAYLNKIIDYYYKKLKPNKELNKAFLSSLCFGMGIVTTYWDSKKEKVITTFIPITDIAFDYEASNIDDIEYIGYKFFESNRVIKQKFDSGFYNIKGAKEKLFGFNNTESEHKRYEAKEIYTVCKKGWEVTTYINNIAVRNEKFEQLPFQYGYSIDKLPSIDSDVRKDEVLVYGRSVIEFIACLNDEINIKRNQKNDIQEEIVNPSIIIPDKTNIKANDLKKGAGKRIRAEGGTEGIMFMPVPSDYPLNNDLSMLANDISDASSVNSIQQGQTGASDRRSANALAVVNANSSMRTEEMITLCNETLFEHWAKSWVKLVLKNADDDIINDITNAEFPLGKKGARLDIEFDISINFGMTIDKEKRLNDLISLLQIIGQNPNMNPEIIERIFKEILTIRMGDSMNIEKIFEEVKQSTQINKIQEEEAAKTQLLGGGL